MTFSWVPRAPRHCGPALVACLALAALAGCGDDDDEREEVPDPHDGGSQDERDSGAPVDGGGELDSGDPLEPDASAWPDAGEHDAGDAAVVDPPLSLGGLTVDMSIDEQSVDLFGSAGHRFWIQVSNEQLAAINSGGPYGGGGDIYTPGDVEATYADHVLVQDGVSKSVADYGQIEVKLVGESTYREWGRTTIPNVKLDSDEFEKGKRIGGFEHIRLNNSLTGTIFREHIVHEIYRALGYPSLRSSYAFLGSNVWGDGVWVPMTLVEVYKRRFCEDNAELLGGTCTNMWEFAGDFVVPGSSGGPIVIDARPVPIDPWPAPGAGEQVGIPDGWCQLHECDNTRLEAAMDAVAAAPRGSGFEAATDPFIDWPRFHQFQCLSWILWTIDDPIHAGNNNLILERDDGRLVWGPYSIDISTGMADFGQVPLMGSHTVANGCQQEPSCWAETIASCEDLIARFDQLDPETMVDAAYARLEALGMLRGGDQERAEQLRSWLVWRQEELADELERYRFLPDAEGNCPEGMAPCNDQTCGTEAQCLERRCQYGESFCEALQRCIFDEQEQCPTCDDPQEPVYCEFSLECVATLDDCAAACTAMPDKEFCPDTHACMPIGGCGVIIID